MNIIVNVDENWAIGCDNALLNFLKEDMRFFRETTLNKTVVMGRKTLASFPNGKPLKNRENIVITHDIESLPYECKGFSSIESALSYLLTLPKENVWIIGGEQIYRSFLPYCEEAKVTKVENSQKNADAFFPNLDQLSNWEKVDQSDIFTENNTKYSFFTYKNTSIKRFVKNDS